MKLDIDKIKDRVSHAPKYVWIPIIVLALVSVLAGVRLVWFGNRAPVAPIIAQQPSPVQAVSAPAAAMPTSVKTAPAAPVSTASTTAIAPAQAVMVEPPTPGIAEPPGLAKMKVLYTLESANSPASGVQATWTEVGHKLIDSRSASFQTLTVKELDTLLPSTGQVREIWSFWVEVGAAGDWTAALKAGGYYQSVVSVQIDGLDVPALTARPWNDVANVVVPLRLGTGWHQVAIRFTQQIRQDPALMHGTAEVFWRGPTDTQPVAIIPAAVAESLTMAAVPASGVTAGGAK